VLAAIIFVATSGCTWNQLPPGFGLSGVTAFRRFTEWTGARVWAKLHRLVLDELGARQAGTLSCLHSHRRDPHMPPPPGQVK
jgi:transposase